MTTTVGPGAPRYHATMPRTQLDVPTRAGLQPAMVSKGVQRFAGKPASSCLMFDENCPKQSFVKSFSHLRVNMKARDGEFNRIRGCAVDHTAALHSSLALEALGFPSAQACWLLAAAPHALSRASRPHDADTHVSR